MESLRYADLLMNLYSTDSWKEAWFPLLDERRKAMEAALRDPKESRKANIPDDYIRGQLDVLDFIINHPKTIAETVRNAEVEEKLANDRQEWYDSIAKTGLGANSPAHDMLERESYDE